jgi:hypothetical protein
VAAHFATTVPQRTAARRATERPRAPADG